MIQLIPSHRGGRRRHGPGPYSTGSDAGLPAGIPEVVYKQPVAALILPYISGQMVGVFRGYHVSEAFCIHAHSFEICIYSEETMRA